MVVAHNIRRLREARGESQQAFSKRTGINRSRLIGWEKGTQNPSLKTLERIADGLEVNVRELLREPRTRGR
jgi:XRE family transcriptional regulator, regulator of sulfur utilization